MLAMHMCITRIACVPLQGCMQCRLRSCSHSVRTRPLLRMSGCVAWIVRLMPGAALPRALARCSAVLWTDPILCSYFKRSCSVRAMQCAGGQGQLAMHCTSLYAEQVACTLRRLAWPWGVMGGPRC